MYREVEALGLSGLALTQQSGDLMWMRARSTTAGVARSPAVYVNVKYFTGIVLVFE